MTMPSASGTGVSMSCANLAACPAFHPAPGYRLRYYRPGDEAAWLAIQRAADLHNDFSDQSFAQQFGDAPDVLARRQLYLLDPAEVPVGTASAWYGGPGRAEAMGRVHWVAIVPGEQGRGLAKPLLSAVCRSLLALGHRQAYLTTSILRVPAINLYFAFGFFPDLDGPSSRRTWAWLLRQTAAPSSPLRPALVEWLQQHLPEASEAPPQTAESSQRSGGRDLRIPAAGYGEPALQAVPAPPGTCLNRADVPPSSAAR